MTVLHDQTLPAGTRIGVYEIKNVLNIGLFDITYRAWNHHFKDWIVLREYFPFDLSVRASDGLNVEPKSPGDKESFAYGLSVFQDQAEKLMQIEHPNIIDAENILPFNGTAYLVMSYQEGVAFSKLDWPSVSFTEGEFREILISLLQALQVVHKGRIVHGGIQPATIISAKDGTLVLTDFCAARLAIAAHTDQLANVLVAGYAPAEQYENMDKTGPATDFYALAATLYYCITHHAPVAAKDRIIAINKGEPDPMVALPMSSENASNSSFAQVINWMLSPDYDSRPQSAAEILSALKSDQTSDKDERATSVVGGGDEQHSIVWIAIIFFGVAILTIVELLSLRSGQEATQISTDPLSLQQYVDQVTIEPTENKTIDVPIATTESSLASDLTEEFAIIQNEIHEPDMQIMQADEQLLLDTNIDNSSVQQQELMQIQVDPSVEWYLNAAQEAINEVRLTTPAGDNAYEYYQKVLAAEPNNVTALSGLQSMVDYYVQLIEKARSDGQPKTAGVYLLRAERIVPDSPRLRSIRAELTAND
jgi:serine/threonine protein kinase